MAGKSGFKVKWAGLDKLAGRALDRLGRTDEVMAALGELVVSQTMRNFQLEQAPDGTKWKKSRRAMGSSDKTAGVQRDARGRFIKGSGKKSKGKSGGKTLQDTGTLRSSITYKVATGGMEVFIGSNLQYAAVHQFGGKAGRNLSTTIPARPYIGLNQEIEDEAREIMKEFIKDSLSL